MSLPALIYSLIGLAVLSGFFYWAGGEGGKWYLNTKVRDLGVPFCAVLALRLFMPWHWTMALTYLALFGALTESWKRTPNSYWYNWMLVGLGHGLAFLPVACVSGHLMGWAIFTSVLSLTTALWSDNLNEVRHEASGRGAMIVLFIPLLFAF